MPKYLKESSMLLRVPSTMRLNRSGGFFLKNKVSYLYKTTSRPTFIKHLCEKHLFESKCSKCKTRRAQGHGQDIWGVSQRYHLHIFHAPWLLLRGYLVARVLEVRLSCSTKLFFYYKFFLKYSIII